MTPTPQEIETMARGYAEAALWADVQRLCTCGADDPNLCDGRDCAANETGGMNGTLEFDTVSMRAIYALCERFAQAHGDDLETFTDLVGDSDDDPWSLAGYCLRMNTGGHGVGFWDREPRGDISADLADTFRATRERLSTAASSAPFDNTGGGDVWQVDTEAARFDPPMWLYPGPRGRFYPNPSPLPSERAEGNGGTL